MAIRISGTTGIDMGNKFLYLMLMLVCYQIMQQLSNMLDDNVLLKPK